MDIELLCAATDELVACNLYHDFPKMCTRKQVFQRFLGLIKFKHLVNDRMNLMLLIKAQHFLEPILRAIQNALERDIPAQRQHIRTQATRRRQILLAAQIANAVDQAAEGHAIKRLPQRLRAAILKHDVRTLTTRHPQHLSRPRRRGDVVDGVVRAERPRAREFRVRRRHHDGVQARRARNLQARDRDAARAPQQHGLAVVRRRDCSVTVVERLADSVHAVQRHPRGYGGDRQARGLRGAQVRRRCDQAGRREAAELGQHAGLRLPEPRRQVGRHHLAGKVRLVEDGHDALAGGPLRRAGGQDRAAEVGAGDEGGALRDGVVVAVLARDDFGVSVVERHGVDLDEDFALFGFGLGSCRLPHVVDAILGRHPLAHCRSSHGAGGLVDSSRIRAASTELMLEIDDMVSFIFEPSDTCYRRSLIFAGSFQKCPSSVIPRQEAISGSLWISQFTPIYTRSEIGFVL